MQRSDLESPPERRRSAEACDPIGQHGSEAIAAGLRRALSEGHLSLRYQPIVDLRAGAVDGVEVLLRWHDPILGEVPPDRFIPIATETELIRGISEWQVGQALRELAGVLGDHPTLKVSFNLEAAQITPAQITSLLERIQGVATTRLVFELTEGATLAAGPASTEALRLLTARGIGLAVDDFGTGHACLEYLERFPIDTVKIDRRFMATVPGGGGGQAGRMALAILRLATPLGLSVVAEGVETREQLAWLRQQGCRLAQGYLFSAPVRVAELSGYLEHARVSIATLTGPGAPIVQPPPWSLDRLVRQAPTAMALLDHLLRPVASSTSWPTEWSALLPEHWRAAAIRLIAGEAAACAEASHLRPDGAPGWYRCAMALVRDAASGTVAVLVTAEDVTALREAEARVAASEGRFRDYLTATSDWLWEMDAELRFLSISGRDGKNSPERAWMVGMRRWEVGGITDPDSDPVWSRHKADLEAHRQIVGFEYQVRNPKSKASWAEVNAMPIFDGDGMFQGYWGITREIGGHRAEQLRLRESAAQLEIAGQLAGLGYWHYETASGDCDWSDEIWRIAGHAQTPFVPTLASEAAIVHPDDRSFWQRSWDEARSLGQDLHCRVRWVRPDGSVRHIIKRGRCEMDSSGGCAGFIGVVQDVTDQVLAQEALEARSRENAIYRTVIEGIPDVVYAKDRHSRFIYANRQAIGELAGEAGVSLIGRTERDLPGQPAERLDEQERRLIATGEQLRYEDQRPGTDGRPTFHSVLKAPIRDPAGEIVGLVGVSRDVTELRRRNAELDELTRALRASNAATEQAHLILHEATAALADGLALFDPSDRLVVCNPAFGAMVRVEPTQLVGQSFTGLLDRLMAAGRMDLPANDRPGWRARRLAHHAQADGSPFERWMDGRWVVTRERRTADGSIVLLSSDMTEIKRVEEELRRLATVDPLTEAFNRRHFVDQGTLLLERLGRDQRPMALAVLDLDHFKQVNDRWGHDGGDRALRGVAQLCAGLLRPSDLFARWGGEEFIILLPDTGADAAMGMAERLRHAIEALRLEAPTGRLQVTASFGVALARSPTNGLNDLIRDADAALYRAKAEGRNRVALAERRERLAPAAPPDTPPGASAPGLARVPQAAPMVPGRKLQPGRGCDAVDQEARGGGRGGGDRDDRLGRGRR